ncbi:MAG: DEAD/DEAH box helicase family protein [Sulfurimonas sp.]|jgi:hypothetical protein
MINFSKLNTGNTMDTLINPRDLFSSLPHKNKKYSYPRDVQSAVWKQWEEKRNDKNVVIKMNTGSGKTVVGLIILKSCLNEKKGPAVFVVPDNFLVAQVIREAESLGLPTTEDPRSIQFQRGKEILVCNIHTLVNGKSKFGVGEKKIDIGSIIIDDAHACLNTIESQFTIKIPQSDPLYKSFLNIFLQSISKQSNVKALELHNSQPGSMSLVPFWDWKNNLQKVTEILQERYEKLNADYESNDNLKFSFPLLKESLKFCRCVISDKEVEITPHNIPIDIIPSLEHAQRKIFMTATLVDDSILSTHFNLDISEIANVITPDTAGDIGDRMILVPQELNPFIPEKVLKAYYKKLSKRYNVVVIVPSTIRVKFWDDVADLIINYENIESGVDKLKSGYVGLVVLINRYDGIDLPDDACRILVIDGLPGTHRMIDKITESQLLGSDKIITQKIQQIEQGMGRGVRSNDDYCVVFLMGSSLIQSLYTNNAIEKFSKATRAQFELSEKLSEQLDNPKIEDIHTTVSYLLDRSDEWMSVSKSVLATLKYDQAEPDKFSISQRLAYNQVRINQFQKAVDILNESVNKLSSQDKILLGYAKQILAEYINFTDEIESQKVLVSAITDNKYLLKPVEGISYTRIKTVDDQANNLQKYLVDNYYKNYNNYIIDINAILDDLIFLPDTANKFEEAIKKLAYMLGFNGQRPENDYGRGPDNLWATGSKNFFIIECKNGVTNKLICKHDVNQLNGSISWFKKEFSDTYKITPIMIHLGDICEFAATPDKDSVVMMEENLKQFKNNVKEFSLSMKDKFNQLQVIKELLVHYKLRDTDIVNTYTSKIKVKSN